MEKGNSQRIKKSKKFAFGSLRLESSFHSYLTPSDHHLTACTYTYELIANCSASHIFAQRKKCLKFSCATWYLPMTQPLQPTQKRLYRDVLAAFQSCKDFSLTISIKKTNVSAQDISQAPSIKIDDHTLDVVDEFTYVGSTISMNQCLDTEINKRIGKASATMAKLTQRVRKNSLLAQYILSTLLYGSETWTTYMHQERRLNTFHMRCMRRILDIKWQDHIPNNDILTRTGVLSIYSLVSQRRPSGGLATCGSWRTAAFSKTSFTINWHQAACEWGGQPSASKTRESVT